MTWGFEDILRLLRHSQAVMGLWGFKYSARLFPARWPFESNGALKLGQVVFLGERQCPRHSVQHPGALA